ncbi:MAG TPA: hypothetical protein VLA58_05350 [Chitinophagaceae bacterium]|nr:hypothetical protein [Chitinophagaceae bacterium]
MGKDREGKFHPGKGSPAGNIKEEGLGLNVLNSVEKVGLPEQIPGVLTKERFTELAGYEGECCISIYLEKPDNPTDNETRFRSQLSELEKVMSDRGMSDQDRRGLLDRAKSILGESDFWLQHQRDQLAFFIAKDVFKYLVINDTAPAERIFENSFYVTPLLPLLRRDSYFYINVISKKGCRLYKADMTGIQPVPIIIPQEVADTKAIPEKDDAVYRSMDSGNLNKANLHGTDNKLDDKELTAGFFEAIDDFFWKEALHDETVPMLLAGVESVLPIYKSVTDYKNLWPVYLTGSREQQDIQELHKDAMELMKPYFEERMTKALEDYGNKSAGDLTSSLLAEIIPGAYYSRIAVLFVKRGEHVWGKFNMEENILELAHTPDEGGEDLIDNAVTQTIRNGGEVFLLDGDKMPADSQMAAVFRY